MRTRKLELVILINQVLPELLLRCGAMGPSLLGAGRTQAQLSLI